MKSIVSPTLLVLSILLIFLTGCGTRSETPWTNAQRRERTALVLEDSRGQPLPAPTDERRTALVGFLLEKGYLPQDFRLVAEQEAADRTIVVAVADDGSFQVKSVLLNSPAPAYAGTYPRVGYSSYDPSLSYYYDPYYWDPGSSPGYGPPIVVSPRPDRGHRPSRHRPDGDKPPRDPDGDGHGWRGRGHDNDNRPDRPPRNHVGGDRGGNPHRHPPDDSAGGNRTGPSPTYQPSTPTYSPPSTYTPPPASDPTPPAPTSPPVDNSYTRQQER